MKTNHTTTETEPLNPIEMLSIAKLTTATQEKKARQNAPTGNHEVDFWVHVFGGLTIGEDYTRTVPQKARPWELLAVALSHLNGVTIDSLTREAINADPEMVASIKAKAESSIREIKGTTESVCSGRIKGNLRAEVTPVAIAQAA